MAETVNSMKKCSMCGDTKNTTNFYNSYSVLFKKAEGHKMCICKDCILDLYASYLELYNNDKKAVYKTCGLLDIYFCNNLFDSAKIQTSTSSSKNPVVMRIYMQKVNSMSQYKNKTSRDSEPLGGKTESEINLQIEEDEEISTFQITKPVVKRWGKNLIAEEYELLEDNYHEWTTRYKCDTLAEEKTYQFICLKELEIRKKRESNENVDKLEETYRKFMSDANVTPKDANAAHDAENVNSLGLWVKDIEKYRPAEYFEKKKLYVDFDKLKEYLDRFVFRPLKNLLTGTRDFDKEFNVDAIEKKLEDGEEL